MSRFMNSRYAALEAYTPGEQPRGQTLIKLNTNESPYPPSPAVVSAAAHEIVRLNLYSDPVCADFRDAVAALYGLKRENVCPVNGSDEALNFCFMAFGAGGACYPDISYGFYPVFAALNGVESDIIPLKEDFTIDPANYYEQNKLVVIANPNAPTGICLPLTAIEEIVRRNPRGVVVVDEAYVDFGGESAVSLLGKYDNLIVTQTFSKSRSMAGARLGMALGAAELIADLEKLRYSTNPYNVNRMTLACGTAALGDNAYYMKNCRRVAATREDTAEALRDLGFTVLPSKANFLFAAHGKVAGEDIYRGLREQGILVRHFAAARIANYNRITIGTPAQMQTLVRALKELI